MSLDDLAAGQGELTLTIDYDPSFECISIEACAPLPQDTQPKDIAAAYLSLCDLDSPPFFSTLHSDTITIEDTPATLHQAFSIQNARPPLAIYAGKKYKPVTLKVRPVETELPSRFRITRNIKGDTLKDMPTLPTRLPPFTPTG